MGCKNSSEQAKPEPVASNRGAQASAGIQTTKQTPKPAPPAAPATQPAKEQVAQPVKAAIPAEPTKEPSTTLHYFDLYGRGEIFRIIFTYLKVKFEDRRVQFSEWPALKTSPLCEFGVLPVLEIQGKRLAQTRSILRFVCQTHRLYPPLTSHVDVYLVESVCDLVDDLRTPLITHTFNKDAEAISRHYDGAMAGGLEMLEARLTKNTANSGFFVGGTVTMADFAVFELLWDYFLMPEKRSTHEARVRKHEKLSQFADRMQRLNPELEAYLRSRQFKWL